MGHPDLSDSGAAPRGLVIFPAEEPKVPQPRSEWWLIPAAVAIAAVLIAIAFAVR